MAKLHGKQLQASSVPDSALAVSYIQAGGTVPWTGNQSLGTSFKITNSAAPSAGGDLTNKTYVDSLVSGLQWRQPVAVLRLIGNASIATIDGLTPAAGDAYVATSAGTPAAGTSDALVIGSLAEFDGTSWQEIVAGSGGFVASGTRAILAKSPALISPYTEATDDNKIVSFDGTTLTGANTSEHTDGSAVLVRGNTAGDGYYESQAYTFEGSGATGTWVQFTGAGAIVDGAGLSYSGNTLNVGDANKGVQVNANDLEFATAEVLDSGGGLKAGSATHKIVVEPADFAGAGLEDDGADNLRISAGAAGNGLTGGGGSALAVLANPTTGPSVDVTASGVKAAVPRNANKNAASAAVTGTNETTTGLTIAATPSGDGYVEIKLNGLTQVLGDGVKTTDCYFSSDGGTTARSISAITAADTLYWNAIISGIDLTTSDRFDFNYNTIV